MNGTAKRSSSALDQLAALGIAARREPNRAERDAPAMVSLTRGRSRGRFVLLEHPTTSDASAVRDSSAEPVLVVADHIAPRTAEVFRRLGIYYVDGTGNASLEFGDIVIDVQGRKRAAQPHTATAQRSGASTNTFSAGRSQVACVLLTWPAMWGASIRELAACAGVSTGLAHDVTTQLREQGYESSNSRLLDVWTASFPLGLRRRIHLADFNGDPRRTPVSDGQQFAIGGESAVADLLRPATLTIYVPEVTNKLIIANRWRTDGEPNIVVRRLFWQAPADTPPSQVAPWPLVYADLATSDDPRLRNAAASWRARFV